MSRREEPNYLQCDVYLYAETGKAYLVSKNRDATLKDQVWIPRSLCNGSTKFAVEKGQHGDEFRFARIKIAEWKAEELGLI